MHFPALPLPGEEGVKIKDETQWVAADKEEAAVFAGQRDDVRVRDLRRDKGGVQIGKVRLDQFGKRAPPDGVATLPDHAYPGGLAGVPVVFEAPALAGMVTLPTKCRFGYVAVGKALS